MAKAVGLIFSLCNITSALKVSFGIPQYVPCIVQGITSALLCVPFIFADSEMVVAGDGSLCVMEIVCVVATLLEVLFKQFLICTTV